MFQQRPNTPQIIPEYGGESTIICRPNADMGHRGGQEFAEDQSARLEHPPWHEPLDLLDLNVLTSKAREGRDPA